MGEAIFEFFQSLFGGAGSQGRLFTARGEKAAIEEVEIEGQAGGGVEIFFIAHDVGGNDSGNSEARDGWFGESSFSGDQTLSCFQFKAAGRDFGAMANREGEKRSAVGKKWGRGGRILEEPIGGLSKADGGGEIGEGGLGIVSGLESLQAGFGHGDFGGDGVEARLKFVAGGGDGGWGGDAKNGLGAEGGEVGLADLKQDLGPRDVRHFRLALGAGDGPFGKEFGAAAIIEQLAEITAEAGAAEDQGIGELSSTDAGAFGSCCPGDGEADLGREGTADLLRDLGLGFGGKTRRGEGGVVAQG